MKMRLGLISLATGMLLSAAVTACDDADQTPPSTTPSESPTSRSPSATPSSPSAAAGANATAAMKYYYVVLDQVRSDLNGDLKRLASVATGTQLKAVETLVERQQGQGRHQTGVTTISELLVQSVHLDNSDPDAGAVPTVVIDVCWDVSGVDLIDESGESVVAPGRPPTGWTRYTLANYKFSAHPVDGWRVATGRDLKQAPCEPA